MRLTRIASLACCTALALMLAGATQASLEVGVTEDAGKAGDGGAAFFTTLTDIGLTANRVSIPWDAANPTVIQSQGEIEAWLPQALAAHTRVIFAVSPMTAKGMTSSPSALPNFVAFVRQLAQTFPMVKDYVIGNEPNQPRFWLPQFNPASGKALAAPAYLPFLARSYDALKAVDPAITVIGVGLSPRGNDQPGAPSNASRSPVRFLHELGVAYRASKRTKPLDGRARLPPVPELEPRSHHDRLRLAQRRHAQPRPDQAGRLGCLPRHRPDALRRAPQDLRETAPVRPRRGGLAGGDPACAHELLHEHRECADDERGDAGAGLRRSDQAGGLRPDGASTELLPPERTRST